MSPRRSASEGDRPARAAVDVGLDAGAVAQLIRDGLARGNSVETIAEQIVALISDPAWARAMSHPTRGAILRLLRRNGTVSPARAVDELDDVSLGTAAYHFRTLQRLGLIEVAEEIPRRGAIEHVYRLIQRFPKEERCSP